MDTEYLVKARTMEMNTSMKDNTKMTNEMGLESSSLQIEMSMKEFGKITKSGKED